jgi:hypothetical protein
VTDPAPLSCVAALAPVLLSLARLVWWALLERESPIPEETPDEAL